MQAYIYLMQENVPRIHPSEVNDIQDKTTFFNGKAKTITKANDIEHELSMSRFEILNVIDKWVSEGSGWVIDR